MSGNFCDGSIRLLRDRTRISGVRGLRAKPLSRNDVRQSAAAVSCVTRAALKLTHTSSTQAEVSVIDSDGLVR